MDISSLRELRVDIEAADQLSKDLLQRVSSVIPFDRIVVRSVFAIWEQCLGKVWEQQAYSLKLPDAETTSLVAKILQNAVAAVPLCSESGRWLGGPAAGGNLSRDRECLLAVLLIGSCLVEDPNILEAADNVIATNCQDGYELVSRLLSQDERLLSVCLAKLTLDSKKARSSIPFQFSHLYLHTFAAISFQYEVLLEWLTSELLAIPFLSRFLESAASDEGIRQLKNIAAEVEEQLQQKHSSKGTWITKPPPPALDDLVLRVKELAGEQIVFKEFRFSKKEPAHEWIPLPAWKPPAPGALFAELYDMLVRLRLKLESLNSRELTAFRPKRIIRLLERFEEIVDDQPDDTDRMSDN